MTVTLRPLRQPAQEFNVAVLVVHHASKGGGSRGSTAATAACDSVATWVGVEDGSGGQESGEAGAPSRARLTIRGRDVPKTS